MSRLLQTGQMAKNANRAGGRNLVGQRSTRIPQAKNAGGRNLVSQRIAQRRNFV
jgi:hypothetical protein